jgi:hypothetical protein
MPDALKAFSTNRVDKFALAPEEGKKKMGSELHSELLPGEDASFDQLYSLQRIEVTQKLRKNHGRGESWQLLIRLKMAGACPCEKEFFRRQAAIILPISLNLTTAKEFDHIAGESPSLFPPVCLRPGTSLRNDSGLVPNPRQVHSLRISCE